MALVVSNNPSLEVGLRPTDLLWGLGSLSNPRALQTPSPGGIAGVNTGFHVGIVFRPLRTDSGNNLLSRSNGSSQGWHLRQSTATGLSFTCYNGVGAAATTATITLTSYVGQVCTAVGVHTGAGNTIEFYFNGALVGSAACVGFTPQSNRMYVGAAGSSTAYLDYFGALGGASIPTADQISSWHNLVKSNRSLFPVPGVTTSNYYPPVVSTTATAPTDTVGSSNFSLVGTGHTSITVPAPIWGR